MHSDEFIRWITSAPQTDGGKDLRTRVPLGVDSAQNAVFAFPALAAGAVQHVCVTGMRRTAFIKRLLFTLARLYTKTEAQFFILSPKTEYGELLRLSGADITVPYIRNQEDWNLAFACGKELAEYPNREHCKQLIFVMDGIEALSGCNQNMDFSEQRDAIESLARKKRIQIISGVDLIKSIFSGYPGAYVGIGNCLVTTREEGSADVTYVGQDSTLTMPVSITYPHAPSVTETIIALNAMRKEE